MQWLYDVVFDLLWSLKIFFYKKSLGPFASFTNVSGYHRSRSRAGCIELAKLYVDRCRGGQISGSPTARCYGPWHTLKRFHLICVRNHFSDLTILDRNIKKPVKWGIKSILSNKGVHSKQEASKFTHVYSCRRYSDCSINVNLTRVHGLEIRLAI